MPEVVRFRHKLVGRDTDWSAPYGAQRIVYSGLPPGHYRFAVIASDSQGTWGSQPTELDFERRPYFYETRLFYACCVCAVALAFYGAHLLRLRALNSRFRLALQERSRIARELHDTLMQSFAGVVYFLAAASRKADCGQAIDREQLRHLVEQADRSLREAREAISCMRLSALEDDNLSHALVKTGKQLVEGTTIRFHAEVKGLERQLDYETQTNLYVIAREAMNNAVMHAHPKEIFLRVTYHSRGIDLLVRDDGDGFDPATIPKNHWGVVGMEERAQHVGSLLEISSKPGLGTTIQVLAARCRIKRE
jgi:signal transduction histidine kinase